MPGRSASLECARCGHRFRSRARRGVVWKSAGEEKRSGTPLAVGAPTADETHADVPLDFLRELEKSRAVSRRARRILGIARKRDFARHGRERGRIDSSSGSAAPRGQRPAPSHRLAKGMPSVTRHRRLRTLFGSLLLLVGSAAVACGAALIWGAYLSSDLMLAALGLLLLLAAETLALVAAPVKRRLWSPLSTDS